MRNVKGVSKIIIKNFPKEFLYRNTIPNLSLKQKDVNEFVCLFLSYSKTALSIELNILGIIPPEI